MSFGSVYKSIDSKIKELLPDSKELLHPEDLSTLNKDDNLSVGYGLTVGSAEILNQMMVKRQMGLVLTRRYTRANVRKEKESELIDEAYKISYSLAESMRPCGINISVLSDDGISFELDNKYIKTIVNFEINYQQEI